MPVVQHNLFVNGPCAGIQGKCIDKECFILRKDLIFTVETHLLFYLEIYQYMLLMMDLTLMIGFTTGQGFILKTESYNVDRFLCRELSYFY